MTDPANDAATPEPGAPAQGETPPAAGTGPNKALWTKAALGIGSAALVAALMYANRPRRKK